LLVTADRRAAEGLARLLRRAGHQVQIAPDTPVALHAARRDNPDVVLLEDNLPGVDGWELAAQLQRLATRKKPFCIVVADGWGQPPLPLPAAAGVDLHLARPVNLDVLRKVLRRFQQVILPADLSRGEERSDR
jgi:DNA-binding response OmpR family regulator